MRDYYEDAFLDSIIYEDDILERNEDLDNARIITRDDLLYDYYPGSRNNINSRRKSKNKKEDKKHSGKLLTEPKECLICFESIEYDGNLVTEECGHFFCYDCFVEYLNEEIKEARVPIHCPIKECQKEINSKFMEKYITEEKMLKYFRFLKKNKIKDIKGAVECPIENCDSYAINPNLLEEEEETKEERETINDTSIESKSEQSENKGNILIEEGNKKEKSKEKKKQKKKSSKKEKLILKCVDNGHEFCSECMNPAHGKGKCPTADQIQWKNFVKWKKGKNVNQCPKCKYFIEKNEGCNHMTCRNCKYQFCWLCGGKYSYEHYDNPLSPCFQMMYAKEASIFARSKTLRILRIILLILFPVNSVCYKFSLILSGAKEIQHRGDAVKYIYQIFSFILGFAFISYGFIILSLILFLSPFIISGIIMGFIIDSIGDTDREDQIFIFLAFFMLPMAVANVPCVIAAIGGLVVLFPVIFYGIITDCVFNLDPI